jgi:hypothetical protein
MGHEMRQLCRSGSAREVRGGKGRGAYSSGVAAMPYMARASDVLDIAPSL